MQWRFFPATEYGHHREAWQAINARGADSAVLHPDFIEPLLRHFGTGREVLAVCADGDEPVALALLHKRRFGSWETFQPSQAPLGPWVSVPSLAWDRALPTLLRSLPGFTAVVGVTQQDPDIHPRPDAHGELRTLDYIQTARISVEGSFDDYWARRGKNLRHNMKRQRNRLSKDGVATRLELLTGAAAVRDAIADYGRLESAGWKSELGTAIHLDNPQGRYYAEMLENFARVGEMRIYRYWYGDRLVATDLCTLRAGVLTILKTTYDETIDKTTSPAFLMRQEAFTQLFDERQARRIEFYGKLMEWHTRWSEEVRTMYHVNYYRWSSLARLRAGSANR
jgi:CelD/BcsL family acetyltransferase involved in cellulose biosynthesis